ncbi:hypothetical protein CDL12_06544 [Handroanthus impetiginosus]|uniref:Uncharacterized protein n=1 Tax=Handroanthus impetiginosus TaxID=429701 RepID=A0A2G9HTC7_9LAMI|nr:hypothetical protein CDL12_06544 [Handroanthus impetiginosus]
MSDWGPVLVAVVLFVLLAPGLLIQIPGRNRVIEFGSFHTSAASMEGELNGKCTRLVACLTV